VLRIVRRSNAAKLGSFSLRCLRPPLYFETPSWHGGVAVLSGALRCTSHSRPAQLLRRLWATRSSPRLESRAPPSPWPPVALWPLRTHRSLRLAAHDTQHHTALLLTALRPAACTQHGPRTPARPFGPAVTAPATQHTQPAAPCELLMGAASRTLTAALPNRHARTPAGSGVGDGVGVRVPVQPAASDPSTCACPCSRPATFGARAQVMSIRLWCLCASTCESQWEESGAHRAPRALIFSLVSGGGREKLLRRY